MYEVGFEEEDEGERYVVVFICRVFVVACGYFGVARDHGGDAFDFQAISGRGFWYER
jgi:hypothetical protein